MRFALAAVLLAGAIVAQDRVPLLGVVRSAGDTPWADAQVMLWSRPIPGDEVLGETDRIDTRTDDAGRFRAMVLGDRSYVVFAHDAGREPGYRVSEVRVGMRPGPAFTLREHVDRHVQRVVRFQGLEAWTAHGPLRAQVVTTAAAELTDLGHPLALPLGLTGEVRLPALPPAVARVEVLAANGVVIAAAHARLTEGGPLVIEAAPPKRYRMLVGDGSERPVPGVTVFFQNRMQYVPLAKSDAQGIVEFVLPFRRHVHENGAPFLGPDLHVIGPEAAHATPVLREEVQDFALAEGLDGYFGAPAARTLKGRLLLDPATPAANWPLVVRGFAVTWLGARVRRMAPIARIVHTDVQGNFSIEGVTGSCGIWTSLGLRARGDRGPLPPRGFPGEILLSSWGPGREEELGTVVLNQLHALELQLRRVDGSAAAGARAFLSRGWLIHDTIASPPADEAGVIRVLATPGGDIGLLAHSGDQLVLARIESKMPGALRSPEKIELALGPSRPVVVQLVDADSKPRPELKLSLGWTRVDDPSQDPVLVAKQDGAVRCFVPLHGDLLQGTMSQYLRTLRLDLNDQGTITVALPDVPVIYRFMTLCSNQYWDVTTSLDDAVTNGVTVRVPNKQ